MKRKPSVELSPEGKLRLTKIDGAVRQLETAIELWFNDGDPVAVCTLAHAAHEVVWQINRHSPKSRPNLLDEELMERTLVKEFHEDYKAMFKMDYNFLKHSGKDPEEIHYLAEQVLPMVMFDAVQMYNGLGYTRRLLFHVLQLWLWMNKPKMFLASPEGLGMDKSMIRQVVEASRRDFFRLACHAAKDAGLAVPRSSVRRNVAT